MSHVGVLTGGVGDRDRDPGRDETAKTARASGRELDPGRGYRSRAKDCRLIDRDWLKGT